MDKWNNRSDEIAYLINPAFSASLIYLVIKEYSKKRNEGLPFSLTYLILPILLHKKTRGIVNSRSNMVKCIQENQEILVGFSKRANSLIDFTNEAIEFLLSRKVIVFEDDKIKICASISLKTLSDIEEKDEEIKDCFIKAGNLGRWFLDMKTEENVYIAWGVKP